MEAILQRQTPKRVMISAEPSHKPGEEIDFSRRFMPEELTPLYHTRCYGRLDTCQQLRYNQLHALYFNEQTMFFEKALARNVLGHFLRQSLPTPLKAGLRQFMLEEEQHTEMFRHLNRSCAPGIYLREDFYFIGPKWPVAAALNFVSKRPNWFPFLLWLMHLQEERALFFGKSFLKNAEALEPHFVAVQRKHVADEVGHVAWDEALLDWVWPKAGLVHRQFNSRIFAWMIEEYFSTPKRAAVRVVEELVKEFPELGPEYAGICGELLALAGNVEYRKSLYCIENVPNTFKRFSACPEFQAVTSAMPGYVPEAS